MRRIREGSNSCTTLLRLALTTPELALASVVVAQRSGVIQDFAPAKDVVFVSYLQGGPSQLVYFGRESSRPHLVPILPVSGAGGLHCWQTNELFFGNVSYLKPAAYSPYHHVQAGVAYPAVLLTTGENDGRVNPAQSRKMAAALQAASASGRPILFRSTASAGHGMGTALKERIAEQADIYSFLFDQLGIDGARWSF